MRGKTQYIRCQESPEIAAVSWDAIPSWEPPDDLQFALDPDRAAYDDAIDAPVMNENVEPVVKSKKKRSLVSVSHLRFTYSINLVLTFKTPQQRPHVVWKDLHRQTYLNEIIRWSGRGDFLHAMHCPDCISRKVEDPGMPSFRCRECFSPDLTCQSCCVKRHRNNPFHRIQASFFFTLWQYVVAKR